MFNLNFDSCEEVNFSSSSQEKQIENFAPLKNIELLSENTDDLVSDGVEENEDITPDIGAPVDQTSATPTTSSDPTFPLTDEEETQEVEGTNAVSDLTASDVDNDPPPLLTETEEPEEAEDPEEPVVVVEEEEQTFFEKHLIKIIIVLVLLLLATLASKKN